MTPIDAEKRIALSAQTLEKFLNHSAVGRRPGGEHAFIIDDEIDELDNLARQHPGKVSQILRLVSRWYSFRDTLAITLH
nr:hypothetical protein [uncultured Devosia sp.]